MFIRKFYLASFPLQAPDLMTMDQVGNLKCQAARGRTSRLKIENLVPIGRIDGGLARSWQYGFQPRDLLMVIGLRYR